MGILSLLNWLNYKDMILIYTPFLNCVWNDYISSKKLVNNTFFSSEKNTDKQESDTFILIIIKYSPVCASIQG